MSFDNVLAHIDAEAIARDTLAFLRVRSETGSEGPGSAFLADLLDREGFDPVLDEAAPGRPNVYARIPGAGAGAGRTLMFNGHTDTIPIGNSLPPGREGDWITGRGAEDMKGGLVAMVHAASALRKAGIRLAGGLWMTGVIGHETPAGKKEGPRRLITRLRERDITADAIVIVEGPCALWTASLGSAIYRITISSPRGPIHTIKVPYEQNPASWLGRLLLEFERLEREFASAPPHPLCGREQLNVGMIEAGDYVNRLPTPIRVLGTWRWMPGKTQTGIREALTSLCARLARQSGLSFEYSLEATREPFETPASHPIVQAFSTAGERLAGHAPPQIGMALVGDANLFANEAGVSTIYYGPAHETAHSDNERVSLERLAHCAKMYALAAMEFCGVATGPESPGGSAAPSSATPGDQ
ncbi:MAG: M20/M25/M40 family metallo-hydrolase [Bryobacterales bacterium]|nr:M20/M25/M40 family metallo-hydrolase [Bryobacterales bacterium]